MSFLLILLSLIIGPAVLPLIINKKRLFEIYLVIIFLCSAPLGFTEQIAFNKNTSNPGAPFGMVIFHIILLSFAIGTYIQAFRLKLDDHKRFVILGYLFVLLITCYAVEIGDSFGMDVNPHWSGG